MERLHEIPEIREVDLSTLDELADLAVSTFTETFGYLYSKDNLERHLAKTCSREYFLNEINRKQCIEIALLNGILAGYVKYGDVSLPITHDDIDAELHRLYVAKAFQGKAIGQKLMDKALSSKRMRNAPRIFLGVWENNLNAQKFYTKYGFNTFGEYTYYVGSQADRELILYRHQS